MDTLNTSTDYHLVLRGSTYPELREAIRRVAIDHGLLPDGAHTAPARDDEPAIKVQDKPASKATGRKGGKKADKAKDKPAVNKDRDPGELIWIHHSESECVYKGTVAELSDDGNLCEVSEEEAQELLAKYEASAEPETEKPAPTETRTVTLEEARTQLMAYVNEHGAAKGKALVDSFGVGKMSDLADQPDKLADLFVKAGGTL